MQIYVIKRGDTLSSIADRYGTTVNALEDANELDHPDRLVVGQTLVIPIIGQFYFVKSGESLYSIAQKFGMTYQELAQVNNISAYNMLPVGFRLYIPEQPKRSITSLGYLQPTTSTVSETLQNAARKATPYLTFLALFNYSANRDGSLNPPPIDNLPDIAAANDTSLSLVITNLEGGSFNRELIHIILTVQAVQDKLLDNIINTAERLGFRDVHFDFENMQPEDREAYNNFLRKAKGRLSQTGLLMSTALAPKTSAKQAGAYEAYDYAAHGEIADFVVLMTYEWGYSYGPPMAVSPINEVQKVVEYALSEMPANKIMLGQNLYGYDWQLPFEQGGEAALALSPQQAIDLAREQHAEIQYDPTANAPFFFYTDAEGNRHEVWFEDARSIQAKFDLIKNFSLRGIAYWKLGLAFPQNWLLLRDNFTVTKSV